MARLSTPAEVSAVCAALGAIALFAAPATAQAATPGIARPAGSSVTTVFSGYTYPDTSAGLSACQAQGAYEEHAGAGDVVAYQCRLGNPDAGLYNLWLSYLSSNE